VREWGGDRERKRRGDKERFGTEEKVESDTASASFTMVFKDGHSHLLRETYTPWK
jgi:hypothetical protein